MSKTGDAVAWIPRRLGDLDDGQIKSISEIVATALVHIAPTAEAYTLAGVRPPVKVSKETAAWIAEGSDEVQTARVLAADSGSSLTALFDPRAPAPAGVGRETASLYLCGYRTPENVEGLRELELASIRTRRAFLRDVDSLMTIYARQREASREDYIACLRVLAQLDDYRPRKPEAPSPPERAATTAPPPKQRRRWPWSRP
jgi:hypothetical protein